MNFFAEGTSLRCELFLCKKTRKAQEAMATDKTRTEEARTNSFLPNAFQTPNVFVDKFGYYLTAEEQVCLQFACRHILGWRKYISDRRRRISLSAFVNGFGENYCGCGLEKNAVIRALAGLTKYGLLIKNGEPNLYGQEWEIPEDDSNIDFAGLRQRKELVVAANKNRTQNARMSKAESGLWDKPQVVCPTDQTGCLSDKPQVVCPTNHRLFVRQTTGCLSDKHKEIQYKIPIENNRERIPSDALSQVLNFDQLSTEWWDECAVPLWIKNVHPRLKTPIKHPGALCGDHAHVALIKLMDANLKFFGMDEFTRRYENFTLSNRAYYLERKYSLLLFCSDFQVLIQPNNDRKHDGGHRKGSSSYISGKILRHNSGGVNGVGHNKAIPELHETLAY